ncbi:hypothetical protein HPB49_017479 [Dermacentor silvarum]|uniref:Uncharacterized protein n=1 Tax=Dermacentor silvarum TaxID=543639 RepID=A0ACB8DQ15_DERSI|nr:hypothetical protein HPB49_017479 [Dermacentor silvarum]
MHERNPGVPGSPKLHNAGFSAGLTLDEDTVATCTVKKSSPGPFALNWHKEALEIGGGNNGRVAVATKSSSTTLSIDAIRVENIGNYSCVARNAFGSESLTLPLIISEAPKVADLSFPSNLAMGDEVIALCVVKKGSTGPYHVSWRKDGAELSPTGRLSLSALSRSSAALRIESLRPGDIGNYTCTASNAFGSDTVTAPLVVNGNVTLSLRRFNKVIV